ncbi:MAG: hypothetical protein ACRBFS_23970 [Aureispira sp.]
MKEILAICVLVLAWCSTASAQFPKQVKVLDVKINSTTSVKGDLSEGQFVDLRFGMRGSVGCFTEAEKTRYDGKHRFYAFKVPANAKVLVEMNTGSDMSLYGYMITTDRFDIPPYLENVSKSGCTASAQPMGSLERIMLKAGSSPMHVVVAVTGVESNESGEFNLKVTTRQ